MLKRVNFFICFILFLFWNSKLLDNHRQLLSILLRDGTSVPLERFLPKSLTFEKRNIKNGIFPTVFVDDFLPKSLTFDKRNIKNGIFPTVFVDDFYQNVSGADSTNKSVSTIDWSNVVIFITIFQSPKIDSLIKAHFKTWLKQVDKGLNVIFVTDKSDERSIDEILPDARNVLSRSCIYKSSAAYEGKHLRYKIIDSLRHIEHQFENNSRKKYFMKMDIDTFIFPENLIAFLQKIEISTNGQPALFGECIGQFYSFCYASGGLYGMNRMALLSINKYIESHPNVTDEVRLNEYGKPKNMMKVEDFMVSYVYREATGYPVVKSSEFFQHGISGISNPPICYHKIKFEKIFYEYYDFFYQNGKMKSTNLTIMQWENEPNDYLYLRTGNNKRINLLKEN